MLGWVVVCSLFAVVSSLFWECEGVVRARVSLEAVLHALTGLFIVYELACSLPELVLVRK